MASSVSIEKFFSSNAVSSVDADADYTTAAAVSGNWLDLRDYKGYAAVVNPQALTGAGLTKLEIVAADDTSGTNLTVIKDSGTVAADAIADYVVLECLAEEIAHLSAASSLSLRYVNVRLTADNAADEFRVFNVRFGAKNPSTGLTANNIT
jgi:hypothetical protein